MNIYLAIGKKIFAERKRTGLTREELAESSQISPSFLAYIEHGKRKASIATIKQIADALKIPMSRLIEIRNIKSKEPARGSKLPKAHALFLRVKPSDRPLIYDLVRVVQRHRNPSR